MYIHIYTYRHMCGCANVCITPVSEYDYNVLHFFNATIWALYVFSYVCIYIYICVCVRVYACMGTCSHYRICMHAEKYVYIYIYIILYYSIYVYLYIYTLCGY